MSKDGTFVAGGTVHRSFAGGRHPSFARKVELCHDRRGPLGRTEVSAVHEHIKTIYYKETRKLG